MLLGQPWESMLLGQAPRACPSSSTSFLPANYEQSPPQQPPVTLSSSTANTNTPGLPTPSAPHKSSTPSPPKTARAPPPQNPRHPPLNQPHILLMIHLHRPNHPRTNIRTRHHLHPAPRNLPLPLSPRLPHIPKIRIQKLPPTLQHPPHLPQKPPPHPDNNAKPPHSSPHQTPHRQTPSSHRIPNRKLPPHSPAYAPF